MEAGALVSAGPVTIKAGKADFTKLAARVEVLEVLEFSATFEGHGQAPGIIRLDGAITARLMQQCARTLEPMETALEEAFSLVLLKADAAGRYLGNLEEEDCQDIEILEDESVDLSEVAVQYLALAINRFPVREGAMLENPVPGKVNVVSEVEDKTQKNPFAALKDLHKKNLQKKS